MLVLSSPAHGCCLPLKSISFAPRWCRQLNTIDDAFWSHRSLPHSFPSASLVWNIKTLSASSFSAMGVVMDNQQYQRLRVKVTVIPHSSTLRSHHTNEQFRLSPRRSNYPVSRAVSWQDMQGRSDIIVYCKKNTPSWWVHTSPCFSTNRSLEVLSLILSVQEILNLTVKTRKISGQCRICVSYQPVLKNLVHSRMLGHID